MVFQGQESLSIDLQPVFREASFLTRQKADEVNLPNQKLSKTRSDVSGSWSAHVQMWEQHEMLKLLNLLRPTQCLIFNTQSTRSSQFAVGGTVMPQAIFHPSDKFPTMAAIALASPSCQYWAPARPAQHHGICPEMAKKIS